MKLIKDLHAILVGLFHMIAGDIREWKRKRREHEPPEPPCSVAPTVAKVPAPKPKTEFISAGVRVQRVLEKRKRYDDYSIQELVKLEEERRKQRDLQFVMNLINQNHN